jgi:hypothetical protein
MPWVRFTGDFDWSPVRHRNRVTVAYKAGMHLNVPRACRDAAAAAGKIEMAESPDAESRRSARPGDVPEADGDR